MVKLHPDAGAVQHSAQLGWPTFMVPWLRYRHLGLGVVRHVSSQELPRHCSSALLPRYSGSSIFPRITVLPEQMVYKGGAREA